MIGPAEIEDMRLDAIAAEGRARAYDAALMPLNRHWASRGAASVGCVSLICDRVFVRAEDRSPEDWKAVLTEGVEDAGFGIVWDGDEVCSLTARPRD